MSRLDEIFGEAARAQIREAVQRAEGKTSGEIVPYVVVASDTYAAAHWLSSLLGALLAPLVAVFVHYKLDLWGLPFAIWVMTPVLVGAAVGYLAAAVIPAWRRVLIGDSTLERRTERRAAVAFLDEEVFKTRDRTGVLIFLSLFEHRVVVLGDEGINRAVDPSEWRAIVDGIVAGVRGGQPAAALVAAIDECGALLERNRLAVRPDDTDELSDELRKRES